MFLRAISIHGSDALPESPQRTWPGAGLSNSAHICLGRLEIERWKPDETTLISIVIH